MSYVATVTVPAGKVAATLTNFVTRVDLSTMPAGWWTDVATDGSNIRVKSAGTVIPFDVVWINKATSAGELFFRSTLTTSAAVFTVETVTGATALAVTDANGRNAVWADYDGVWLFESGTGYTVTNRQGDATRDATFVGTEQWRVGSMLVSHTGYGQEMQGLAYNPATGGYVVTFTDAIRRLDSSFAIVAANTNVYADTGIAGANHVGDPCLKDGEIFVGVTSDTATAGNHDWVCVFDPDTLAFKRKYNIADSGATASLTFNPEDGYFYAVNYYDGTKWWKYDTSFNLVGTVTLATATGNVQGIQYLHGYFYASYNPGSGNGLLRFNLDGTNRIAASPSTNPGNTPQGLTATNDHTLLTARSSATGGEIWPFTRNFAILPGTGVDLYGASTGYRASALPKRTTWTVGASASADQNTSNSGVMSYSDNSTTDGNRSTFGQRSTGTWADWNTTDTWLEGAATTIGQRRRLNKVHDATVKRIVYVNGVAATDTTVAQRPGGLGDTMFIGCSTSAVGSNFDGKLGHAYLRNGELSANWITAEAASWESPSTFYTVTADTSAITGTLATSAPAATVTASGSFTPPPGGSDALAVTAPAAQVDAVGEVALSGDLAVTAPAAVAAGDGSVDAVAAGPLYVTAPAARVNIAGNTSATIQTDTSNDYDGRLRDGLALVSTSVTVVVPTNRGQRVDKAIAYPTPNLVDGRPT